MTSSRNKRPLFRGTIISVDWRWYPVPGKPDEEWKQCTLSVWCQYCSRYHDHGWNPAHDGRIATHRCAHCSGGPFSESGYYISPWRQSDPGYSGHVIKPGVAIRRPKPVKVVS